MTTRREGEEQQIKMCEMATKAIDAHGLGAAAPPKSPELWERFKGCPATEQVQMDIENRFFCGYDHAELDWSRPVHGIFVDFKGDGMQLGMLLKRLEEGGQQYAFVAANNPAFNGGWHFSAVNDFEHPSEQAALDSSWRNIRIWTRVNYVCSTTADRQPALTPRDDFRPDPANKHTGALPINAGMRFMALHFTGGLMPHTLIATALPENGPMDLVIGRHVELGATLGAIGHGLDVLIACENRMEHSRTFGASLAAGFQVAPFPKQGRLLGINGLLEGQGPVCQSKGPMGATIVSASYWGPGTAQGWFEAMGLPASAHGGGPLEEPKRLLAADTVSDRCLTHATHETVFVLDVGQLPGMQGAHFRCGAAADAPKVAVFVDDVADPIEAYIIVTHLMQEQMEFTLISHSAQPEEEGLQERRVTSETVFGNPMYGLRECTCVMPTLPANLVPAGSHFDSVCVAGGQCPYHMLEDPAIRAIIDGADVAAAVCHGPELLAGSKWLRHGGFHPGHFTSYYGCWTSFRDMLDRYERKKPGETHHDGRLFTGNAPNSTKEMMVQACEAITKLRQGRGQPATAAAGA